MWSWSINITDRQTTCDRKTALCTIVHCVVKTAEPIKCHLEATNRVDPKNHRPVLHKGHHLANTIKRSVPGGDAGCRYHTVAALRCCHLPGGVPDRCGHVAAGSTRSDCRNIPRPVRRRPAGRARRRALRSSAELTVWSRRFQLTTAGTRKTSLDPVATTTEPRPPTLAETWTGRSVASVTLCVGLSVCLCVYVYRVCQKSKLLYCRLWTNLKKIHS